MSYIAENPHDRVTRLDREIRERAIHEGRHPAEMDTAANGGHRPTALGTALTVPMVVLTRKPRTTGSNGALRLQSFSARYFPRSHGS
jgi:hypothetical protein